MAVAAGCCSPDLQPAVEPVVWQQNQRTGAFGSMLFFVLPSVASVARGNERPLLARRRLHQSDDARLDRRRKRRPCVQHHAQLGVVSPR